jgi:uncharacterized protein involved in exopolysaccharide biosynthesis
MDVEEENEISLLDLLVVVAENLKLLILGPFAAGLLGLGIAFTLPHSYVSQAILVLPTPTPTPTQAAAMMISPIVLDRAAESLKLSKEQPIQVARKTLANVIKVTAGKDDLLRLDVSAPSAIQAQAIANAVIDSWLISTVPSEDDRADLEKRLVYAKLAFDSTTRFMESVTTKDEISLNEPLLQGQGGITIVAVEEWRARSLEEVLSLQRMLNGLSRDIVIQPPTLPTEHVSTNKGLFATLSALAAGFALLLWVFMHQAWRNAVLDPQAAPKLARLRAALGWHN